MKKPTKQKGLGDTIAKATEVTGIDKLAKFILGEDCGCDKRKDKLNELFPYRKSECLTEDEYNYLSTYFESTTTFDKARPSHITTVTSIHDRLFSTVTNCFNCFPEIHSKIKLIYETY